VQKLRRHELDCNSTLDPNMNIQVSISQDPHVVNGLGEAHPSKYINQLSGKQSSKRYKQSDELNFED